MKRLMLVILALGIAIQAFGRKAKPTVTAPSSSPSSPILLPRTRRYNIRMKTLLILFLLLMPLRALAFCDGWRTSDTVLTSAYTALLYQDWSQTKQFISDRHYNETSPALNSHPSGSSVDTGVLASLVGVLFTGCLLDDTARTAWLAVAAGVELQATQVGWRLGFHGSF